MSAAPFGYGKVRASFTDIGLLIGRLTIGAIVFMHGWQKFTEMGYSGVVEMFNGINAPLPQLTAALVILLEVVGSVALAVGIFTRVVAVLIAIDMAGALVLLHLPNGFFVADGGYEFVALIGGTSLIYAFAGPGRLSIDAIFLKVMSKRGERAAKKADAEATTMLSGIAASPASAPRTSESSTSTSVPTAAGASASGARPAAKTETTSIQSKRDAAAAAKQASVSADGTDAAKSSAARPSTSSTPKSDASAATHGADRSGPGKTESSSAGTESSSAGTQTGGAAPESVPADKRGDSDTETTNANGTNRITV